MQYVWKKHTIGKRILALFLLVTMLFDTVTASAVEYDGEEITQTELVEVIDNNTETNSEFVTELAQLEVHEEVVAETETITEGVMTEKVTTEEVVTEREVVTEEIEIVEEIEQTTDTNLFDNLTINFSGYKAYISGSITNSYDTYYELSLKSYDASGKELGSYYVTYLYPGDSNELDAYDVALDKNTDYVQLVLTNYSNNDTYSKTYDFEFTPIVVGTFENISIAPRGYSVEIKGSFTPSTKEYGEIYLVSYDKNDNRLLSNQVTSIWNGEKVEFTYYSGTVANDAAYVRLEAKINDTSLGAEPVYSDKIAYSATRPSVNLALKGLQTGAGTLKMTVSYDGELGLREDEYDSLYYRTELVYGTSEDETTWTNKTSASIYLSNDATESTATFQNLTADTTFYGKARIYYSVYDYDTREEVILYETSLDLGIFTTKANHTYKLNEAFPDAVFCKLVRERMYDSSLTDESEVTTAQLEKITSLSNYRGSSAVSPVRDLTGITLLTNLTSISMENNEISNVADINWTLLTELESLYLSGNNIKVFPDLTRNTKLERVSFENNMLSEEELKSASSKLPEGVTLSENTYETQRTEDVELVLSGNYYLYGDVTNIGALIKGVKIYTAKAYIDDVEVPAELQYSRELLIKNVPVTAGEHTLKVALYDGETKVCESKSYQITIIDEPLFYEKDKYYVPADVDYVYVRAYICEDKTPTSFELVDSTGKIYGRTDNTPNKSGQNYDPRLEDNYYFGNNYYFVYSISGSIEFEYHTIPTGMYDVKIHYSDGTVDTLEDIVQVVEVGTPIITDIYSASNDLEKLEEYVYIRLSGYNLDPAKFEYSLTLDNKEYALSYIEHKADSVNYFNVKCAKEGWSSFPEESVYNYADISVTPKSGYSVMCEEVDAEYYIYRDYEFVYYTEYNNALNKLEVGISDKYLNQTAQFTVKKEWNGSVIASAQEVVTEGVTLVALKNTDGTPFVPVNGQSYYMDVIIGQEESEGNYFSNYYYNNGSGGSVNVNYWYVNSLTPVGTEKTNAWFYTDIPYENNTEKVADYSATMCLENSVDNVNASRFWIFNSNGYVGIGMEFATKALAEGTYYIELFKNGNSVSATSTKFINTDKFILLRNPSISWESETELSVYLSTINTNDTDNFTVQLIDPEGNVVTGLTTRVTDRYSNALYLAVTGLNYADAAKKYYVKVSHNTLGEACKADKTAFYEDEKGIFSEIYLSKWGHRTEGARTVALYLYEAGLDFPVTLQIYRPYSTTVVKEVVIANTKELENGEIYKFTKSFCESLPNKDLMYDIAVLDADGVVATNSKVIFGYEGQEDNEEEETKVWTYTVDKTTLNIDSESLKTATITVKDYTDAPTFKSSNTKVVTVLKGDNGKATITAVAEGTATITITADGKTETFDVTVVSTVPKVTAQSKVEFNTFFGNEAATALKIKNSFDTKVTNVSVAEAGFTAKEMNGRWYLCWDGVNPIAKDTKLTLTYEVEGFTATDDLAIAPQTITVNGKSTQPITKLSATALNFKLYPFKEQSVYLSVENNDYRNIVMVTADNIVLKTAPSGVDKENAHISFIYDESGKLTVKVENEAKDGTYKYAITPGVGTDGAKAATTVNLTVTVKATKPVFKFNSSTVTLDAAYPGSSEGVIKLLMDEGYTLEDVKIVAPNEMSGNFIATETFNNGTIIFRVIRTGLSTAGTYVITPTVKAPQGEIIELAQQKITVKVTNSSTVSLSSKSKSITINPNLGNTTIDAKVKVKGLTQQTGVYYETSYEAVPTNNVANEAGMYLSVASSGAITVSNAGSCEDDKYTYNLVATIQGSDGTVTYSKPLPLTVQLKTKALTIVPEKKSVTVYKDYCTTIKKENQDYYQIVIPVSVKESAKMRLYTELVNSMEDKGVCTYFSDMGDSLVLEFPTTLSSVKNLNITPDDERFASFKVSVTVKSSVPKAAFEQKTVTMNRYTDSYKCNSVADTEGYTISHIKDVVIKKGSTIMENEWFEVDTWDSTISLRISADYDAEVANASYKVSVTPVVIIDDEEKELAPCTFTLKVTQPTVKLEVGSDGEKSKKVYLHPSIGVTSAYDFINAFSNNQWLEIAELSVSTKDKKIYTSAITEDAKWVDISALEAEDGTYKNGKNSYTVTAKVVKANGVIDTKQYTLKNAFVVNVCDLPKSIQLAKSKLTFSPNIADNVTTSVKSTELNELVESGEFFYDISVKETNKKYVELEDELKNSVLDVGGTPTGNIVVNPGSSAARKNATYYYLVTVNLSKYDENYEMGEVVKTYTTKLSVAVKNTKPKAKLQLTSISLDNAFVKQSVTNEVMLTTGTAYWNLKPLTNVKVMCGSKNVTDKEYFNIAYDEESPKFTVSLNNQYDDGTLMTVAKGTYKIVITPEIISESYEEKEIDIAPITLTVKVTSSRPTVKVASKATVKAGGDEVILTPTLKNNGKITSLLVTKITKPRKATEDDLMGIWLDVLEDGSISVYAEDYVLPGTYKYTINPVTVIDDMDIVLDKVTISVVVKK